MHESISFDRAADYYDETRGFPPIAGDQIARALDEWLEPSAACLEIGAGTGRIALPLIHHGFSLTGIDLSPRMLARFRMKALPSHPQVALADAHKLPFPSGSFQAVISVHILHLVADWQAVIQEARRVIQPKGSFLIGFTWSENETPDFTIRQYMEAELARRGYPKKLDFVAHYEQIQKHLESVSTTFSQVTAVKWSRVASIRETLEHLQQKIFSQTWNVPDDEYAGALKSTTDWAVENYRDPDRLYEDIRKFVWHRYQW